MKKWIWRKIVIPSFIFLSTIILIVSLKKSGHNSSHHFQISPKDLKLILAKAERANSQRIHRIEETCRAYNLGLYKSNSSHPSLKYPPTPQYSVYYFDVGNKIAYCPVYKAGSTTWLYNLCLLNGEKEENMNEKQISEVARAMFPELDGEVAEMRFPQSKRLLCVRHPFDRLLSAYRDKLESKDRAPEHGTLHFYNRWGIKIRNKFRTSGQLEPTFQEFVKYLIVTDLMAYADDHWIPYNAYCTPCLVRLHMLKTPFCPRYDYIAKVETLTEDQLFFIHSQELSSWISPSKRHSSKSLSSVVAKEYYSLLTKEQVNMLYKKYELDFQMFNYSINPYLEYARH